MNLWIVTIIEVVLLVFFLYLLKKPKTRIKKFHGIEVFEAIALYSDIKVYRTDPVTKGHQLIEIYEALDLLSKIPNQIWAEIDESDVQKIENDITGDVCGHCGMTYIPRLENDEIHKIHALRKELLKYANGTIEKLDQDSVLFAEMLIGNYELFNSPP